MLRIQILLICPNPSEREALKAVLSAVDTYEILEASSAEEALQKLSGPLPKVAVFRDGPGLEALTLMRRFAGECPEVVRVLAVDSGGYDTVVAGINAGLLYRTLMMPSDEEATRTHIAEAASQAIAQTQ